MYLKYSLEAIGMLKITEFHETNVVKIAHECDVLVAGGGVAGIAAVMCDDFAALDVKALQAELRRRGVKLHESEIDNA